ncbi:Subtilin transport ATP-binding protein SpaT [Psilocybe cubensis]|nr:Subtilin transport ATP-binding protein SpaT [Psilocybe cubensis]KAH9482951.1 Subtilin transport ATP-binding protein SpaT [Psilocybe cubensis]
MVFQGLFLMSAFTAGMKLKPKLNPKREERARYISSKGGASIVARGLSYTYPGSDKPALKNINFSLNAGETLAIVGYNGSGKSTLAKILLRIVDYDKGSLLVNNVNVRNYHPADYHSHLSAVFQGFSKYSSTLKENVGLGNIDKIGYVPAIQEAIHLAEADKFVESLPHGLKTMLATPGFESMSYPGMMNDGESSKRHDLSGGEWQKVALARAFMRAKEPGVDLLIFDEPTSSLDALAQSHITATLKSISRTPTGERTKTIIYITHSVATARGADKIAMMKDGTITEFGTHEELLSKPDGGYAALYNAAQGNPSL